MSAPGIATINKLIIEYHRITRQSLCTHKDDDVVFYDRIVINNVVISSRKNLLPDNACKVNNLVQTQMVYTPKSQSHTSKHSYTHTNELLFHGGGQGHGNVETL